MPKTHIHRITIFFGSLVLLCASLFARAENLKKGFEIKISGINYIVSNVLRNGGYGQIYEIKEAADPNKRSILKVFYNMEDLEKVQRIHKPFLDGRIKSPYVSSIYSAFEFEKGLALHMEMNHSSIDVFSNDYTLWANHTSVELTRRINAIETLFGQVLMGMSAIHKAGFAHLDIRDLNILINPTNGRIQINDYDLLQPLGTEGKGFGVRGTSAPEQLNKGIITEASDYYSVGVTILDLMSKREMAFAIDYDNSPSSKSHLRILNNQFYRITDYIEFQKHRFLDFYKDTVSPESYEKVRALFLWVESTILGDPNERLDQLEKNKDFILARLKDPNIQKFFTTTRFQKANTVSCSKSM